MGHKARAKHARTEITTGVILHIQVRGHGGYRCCINQILFKHKTQQTFLFCMKDINLVMTLLT
jgi:hypothetical protein